jgi:hypothetical protein
MSYMRALRLFSFHGQPIYASGQLGEKGPSFEGPASQLA